MCIVVVVVFAVVFFFQAEDGIRDVAVTGVQTCALPISACPSCLGKRLRPEALAVRINQLDISDTASFSIREAAEWFGKVNDTLTPQSQEIASRILKEIRSEERRVGKECRSRWSA